MLLLSSADFFKINFFKKFFQEHYQSDKQFESRSGLTLQRFGSKLFAKVISRRQKLPLAGKELNMHMQLSSGTKSLIFGMSLHLLSYFMYANSECSGEMNLHPHAASSESWLFADEFSTKIS